MLLAAKNWDPPVAVKAREEERKKQNDIARLAKERLKNIKRKDWRQKVLKTQLQLVPCNEPNDPIPADMASAPYRSLLESGDTPAALGVVNAESKAEVEEDSDDEKDAKIEEEMNTKGRMWDESFDSTKWLGEVESMMLSLQIQENIYETCGVYIHFTPFTLHKGMTDRLLKILRSQAELDSGTDHWATSFRDFVFEESLSLECRSLYRRGLLTDLLSNEGSDRQKFVDKARANSKPQALAEKEFGFKFCESLMACITEKKPKFFDEAHDLHDLFVIHFFSDVFREITFPYR